MPAIWLPDTICIDTCGGDFSVYLETIYDVYQRDLVTSRPCLDDKKVVTNSKLENDKEITFWHIIQKEDNTTGERLPDLRRCERVCWIRPIIENANDDCVLLWELRRNRQNRVYLWYKDQDYLIVLRKTPDYYVIITAFYVGHSRYRDSLLKEYQEHAGKQKPPF